MSPTSCILTLLMGVVTVWADFPCLCNYEVEIPVLSQPDPTSQILDNMYEFDCKPSYVGFSGTNFTAVQIGGKLGYVSIQSNIQLQTCGGEPSLADLIPTTTKQTTVSTTQIPTTVSTTQMPTTFPTTQMPTTVPTTQMPTTVPTTQMPTTVPTTQMPTIVPTTQIPTTVPTTQMPTTVPTTQMPTTVPTTQMPTTVPTTQMPTTVPTTQMPTAVPTTQMPTTVPTTQMPTTVPTTQMPKTIPTTQMPTTVPTTQMPTTVPTTQMPTTISTTQMPTTVPTAQMPTTVPTTQMPTAVPTTQMPTTVSTTQMPTTGPTTQMSTTVPTTQMPTTVPTTQMPTTVSTTQMPTTVPTTQMPTAVPTTQMPTTVSTTTTTVLTTASYHTTNVTNSILKYIGVAYNLTNGNPVSGTATPSMTDPGLLLGNQVFQLNEYTNGTSREVEITSLASTCKTIYSLIHNGKSYQDELSTLVTPTVGHPQQLMDSAFIFNQEFNKVRSYTENPLSLIVYQDVLTLCSQRKLRLKDEMADREPISITRDFAKDACDLPESYDVNEYVNFLDKWGTSIVIEAVLGTKQLNRFQTTEPEVFKAADNKNPDLLHHTGSYKGYASSLTLSRIDYDNNVASTANMGTSVTTYRSHVGELVPVGLKLVPITYAFDWKFWKDVIGDFMVTGVCRDDITTTTIQRMAENMNKTLSQYVTVKNAMPGLSRPQLTVERLKCSIIFEPDSDLKMPVTWPKGTYGLMKPKSGCPTGHVTWHEGWRVQEGSHLSIHHHFTGGISNTLAGTFNDRIKTYYCMKTSPNPNPYDRDWPRGNYCILKKGHCPTGFSEGSIYWDDEDVLNRNDASGTLPDGTYNKNTRIYYCCRSDGLTSNQITLPVDRSFVLIRYKGACQSVYAMSMREVFIEWDTSDFLNKDDTTGAHPLDDAGRKNHRLHFCFYYYNTGGVIIG